MTNNLRVTFQILCPQNPFLLPLTWKISPLLADNLFQSQDFPDVNMENDLWKQVEDRLVDPEKWL